MCLGIPGQIVAIINADEALATVDIAGVRRPVNIAFVMDDRSADECIGDWVLVHVGFAMSRIDADEAARTLALLEELGEMQAELEAMQDGVDTTLPLPLRDVWTGDKGYRCSGTWVTPFRVGSKRIPDLMLLRRLWGCGHRSCDVHNPTGRCVERPQINPADALNAVRVAENPTSTPGRQPSGRPAKPLPKRI